MKFLKQFDPVIVAMVVIIAALFFGAGVSSAADDICSEPLPSIVVTFADNEMTVYSVVAATFGLRDGDVLKTEMQFWTVLHRQSLLQLDMIKCMMDKVGTQI